MFRFLNGSRSVAIVCLCVFLSACSHTTSGVSTYSGNIGKTKLSSKDVQERKIQQARKRAKAAKEARKKAFLAKRKTKGALEKQKNAVKKSKRVSGKKRLKKRKTTKISKGKVNRVKRKTSAFAGGRSRGISKRAPWKCVPARLKKVIAQVSAKFGPVVINSTHRSRGKNRRIGGKKRSYHLACRAVDFRVKGGTKGLTRWLARHPLVGGYKRYRSGFYHIDTGPKRTW